MPSMLSIGVGRTMAHGPNVANHVFLWVMFYWNTAIGIHLYVVYDYFCEPLTGLSTCDKDHMAHTEAKIFAIWSCTDKADSSCSL